MEKDLSMLVLDWKTLDVATLKSLVTSQTGIDSLVAVLDQDAVTSIDGLEEAPNLENRCRELCASVLHKICTSCTALPKSRRPAATVEIIDERTQATGGFAKVIGTYRSHPVAVKVLKESKIKLENVKKHFIKNTTRLDEAIFSARERLELCPPGHTGRAEALRNLEVDLYRRFQKIGRLEDIEEAIACARECIELRPPGNSGRAESLNDLGVCLGKRFEKTRRLADSEEAIQLARECLELRPTGHPSRAESLRNLGIYLGTRFKKTGRLEDIEEAIERARECVELCSLGHPGHAESLRDLGIYLGRRFNKTGRLEDIEEAIERARECRELRPPGHARHAESLRDLRIYLGRRFKKIGRLEDIEEEIQLLRELLELYSPGHQRHFETRWGLVNKLYTFFSRTLKKMRSTKPNNLETLESAILIRKESLEYYLAADPRCLVIRYQLNVLYRMSKQVIRGNHTPT